MSKKISASKLSEMLNIPEHPPIVGGTLSRDWLYTLYESVLVEVAPGAFSMMTDDDVALLVKQQNLPARFGKHAIVRALFELLNLGDAEDHVSAGGTVKGTALKAILEALQERN